ncbi:MAG TPA: type II and III secretion system protein [Armatimonadota bacterium]|nr:type II and III secretion system protein [Armatimonadota bacterium]
MTRQLAALIAVSLATSGLCAAPARADITYTNITSIKVNPPLTNGVQIVVTADGVLQSNQLGGGFGNGGSQGGRSSQLHITFPQARFGPGVPHFINVAEYPVSYIQAQIPQSAPNGIGVSMTVAFFTPSSYTISQSPDQQSVIITVNSERTLVGAPRGAVPGAVQTSTGVTITVDPDGKVTIQAIDADIHEVLAKLAHLTGLNIAVDDRVNRKVSLSLSGDMAADVIGAIANGYGLALSQINGVYMVSEGVPTDLATYHLSGTESFPMKYLEAETAAGLLPTFLFQYLHVNNGQNAVVVTAPTQMLAKIGADLARLDVPPPLIQVDAIAVEFSDTRDINESLGFIIHRGDRTTSFDSGTGMLEYQTIGKLPYSFMANLNALIQTGKAQIRANPSLTVVNGRSATIFIGDERYIQVQFNSYGGLQTQIQGVDVGTHLSVTPWTGGNGEITTLIEPEVSNISEIDLQTGLPILSDRKATTTVRVKDGDTIVIGGLVQKQRYVTNGKIPILGDIPLIGRLFRSHKVSTVHSELMIFITPHILNEQGQIPNESAARKSMEQTLLHSMETDEGGPKTEDGGRRTKDGGQGKK